MEVVTTSRIQHAKKDSFFIQKLYRCNLQKNVAIPTSYLKLVKQFQLFILPRCMSSLRAQLEEHLILR